MAEELGFDFCIDEDDLDEDHDQFYLDAADVDDLLFYEYENDGEDYTETRHSFCQGQERY